MTKRNALWAAGMGLVLVVGAGTILAQWAHRSSNGGLAAEPAIGNVAHRRDAPRFKLKDSAGREHALEGLQGNVVIVHFWASWCPPCLDEIPAWLDFARTWHGRPVKFVAVSLDSAWADALKILPDARLPAGMISVRDEEGKLPDRFGTYQYPETYLLDPDLKIVSKWIGPQDWASPVILSAIEGVLSSRAQSR